jgi:hypothetical protein
MVPVSRIAVMDFVPRPKECRDPYSVAMGREADALPTVSIQRFFDPDRLPIVHCSS